MNNMIDNFNNQPGFMNHNNIVIKEVKEDSITVEVALTENSMNPYNMAHGGLVYSLADSASGLHVYNISKRNAVTLNSNISFLKPGTGSKLIARTESIKNGKNISVVRCNIYNDKDELVATAESTFYFTN